MSKIPLCTKARIIEDYYSCKYTAVELANKYNCSEDSVHIFTRDFKKPISEKQIESLKRRKIPYTIEGDVVVIQSKL